MKLQNGCKGATINCQNDDGKCFQYAITIALNYDEIGNHHQRVNKVKPFTDKYNWKDINFPSHVDDWKKFELNNKSIALNVLYVPEGEKTIRHAYKSKYNLTRENQVILLMVGDGEKWHYLTVRSLSALLKGITSKHKGDSYCLNCFYSYPSKESLEKHMKVCEDKDYCYIEMPKKGETLDYHPGVKSMKAPDIIDADIESLLRKKWMLVLMIQVNHQRKRKMNMNCVDIHCLLTVHLIKKNKLDYYRCKEIL